MVPEWTQNRENLLEFGDVLIEVGYLDTPRDVLYFMEKPWKWDNEYQLWAGCGSPVHGDESWDWFVQKLEQQEHAVAIGREDS